MTIGEKIKSSRKSKKLTQKQLSEKCGLAEITIRQYEANKYIPKIGNLQKIAEALDIPLHELMGVSEMREWSLIANEFPSAHVTEINDEFQVSIGSSEEEAYINAIARMVQLLNLDELKEFYNHLNRYLKSKSSSKPPTTE